MGLESKGKAIRKNYTLYEKDIAELEKLMEKYKLDASETIRQLINNQYKAEFDRIAYKYDTGKCKICSKQGDLYKGIIPDNSLDIEERILDNMCNVCISKKILKI